MKLSHELILLTTLLLVSTPLTIGLTYVPCYASLCSEEFFPYATRLHIASFYALLLSTALLLSLRLLSPTISRLSASFLLRNAYLRVTVGGLLIGIWLVGILLATTGFWLDPTVQFWKAKTDPWDWSTAKVRLVVTGIIGHHVDVVLGLVILPVSRNSLLGRVFRLHISTLLYAHKLLAYLLLIGVFAHGAAYYAFIGTFRNAPEDWKENFDVDNPTLSHQEATDRKGWPRATLPTGMIAFLAMLAMTITSLPWLRRRAYNVFYYTHITGSIIVFITTCIHASTDFYFLLPGLVLWMADWVWRVKRGRGWKGTVVAKVEDAGKGWYRIVVPAREVDVDVENTSGKVLSPVQSFYLAFPTISNVQNHAFTAAKITSNEITFLLQRASGKKQKKLDKEWTWKLGALVTGEEKRNNLNVRVEGPYIPSITEMDSSDIMICIVGGTGITGAYSLALWWLEQRSHNPDARFHLIWTVRYAEIADLDEWKELERLASEVSGISLSVHISSESGRLVPKDVLRGCLLGEKEGKKGAWVYLSGPEGLLDAGEGAFLEMQSEVRKRRNDDEFMIERLDFYSAKWEV